jgi:hypothetical protein
MKIRILHYKNTYLKFFQGIKNSPPEKMLDETFHKYLSISSIMKNMQIKCLV